MSAPGDVNLADMWEALADAIGDAPALIHGDQKWTWAQFDAAAASVAGVMERHGVGADTKVALYLRNHPAYLISTFAAFKLRAVPINVNYRYETDELRYLMDNSDAAFVVVDDDLAERLPAALDGTNQVKGVIVVPRQGVAVPDLGVAATPWDAACAGAPAARLTDRCGDDLWFLYTGGTTGMPKAVMWPHRSLVMSWRGSFKVLGLDLPTDSRQLATDIAAVHPVHGGIGHDRAGRETRPQVMVPAAPLMHGTSAMLAMSALCTGGCVVTLEGDSFDAEELWAAVQRHGVSHLAIVGDAFARPMLAAAHRLGAALDVSTLAAIYSSGAMWSQPLKDQVLDLPTVNPNLLLVDLVGSSEGVGFASSIFRRNRPVTTGRFRLGENAQVLGEDGTPVEPGSGIVGRLAVGGPIPLGYYKDEARTAEAFQRVGDRVWSIPGDHATVESDGTIRLLGRGSVCINTGGEKVFPEEVEEAIKTHPGVRDCNVVGVADERWGQAVCAVVECEPGATVTLDDLREHLAGRIAPYKRPKYVVGVERLQRSPNGKSDYRWAAGVATAAVGGGS